MATDPIEGRAAGQAAPRLSTSRGFTAQVAARKKKIAAPQKTAIGRQGARSLNFFPPLN